MIFGLIVLFLMRMLREREIKETVKSEVLITLVGCYLIANNWRVMKESEHALLLVVLSAFIGLVFGMLRAKTMNIYYQKNEQRWVKKGTWLTIIVFLFGILINRLIALPFSEGVPAVAETLHMGISLLGAKIIYLKKRELSTSK